MGNEFKTSFLKHKANAAAKIVYTFPGEMYVNIVCIFSRLFLIILHTSIWSDPNYLSEIGNT